MQQVLRFLGNINKLQLLYRRKLLMLTYLQYNTLSCSKAGNCAAPQINVLNTQLSRFFIFFGKYNYNTITLWMC